MKRGFRYVGIFFSVILGSFILLVTPFFVLPLIPLILGPFFISLSDLPRRSKLYFGIYPFVLFLVSYFLFYHRDATPRVIRFYEKGWHQIYFGVYGQPKIERKGGYDLIDFKKQPVILTGCKQGDIIPISGSQFYFHSSVDSSVTRIYLYSDAHEIKSPQSIHLYYEIGLGFDSSCLKARNLHSELYFIGTAEDYECRRENFPYDSFLMTKNRIIQNYCKEGQLYK